jgi:predicted DsbA family dithiol-disulfide isomerase
LFYSYTRSEHKIKFPSSIASPFCYAIKLQVSLLLIPLSIYPKKRFECSKKRERKEKKKKRENKGKKTNVPT